MNSQERNDFAFGTHQDKDVIWLNDNPDNITKHKIKVLWSKTQRSWYVADNATNRRVLGLPKTTIAKQFLSQIHPHNQLAFQRYVECLQLKSYSPNTIKTYSTEFAQLLLLIKNFPVEKLSTEKLRAYFLYCINTLHLSDNHLHSRINAIKFYFEKVLHKTDFFLDIPRPKKPSRLPKVINQKDIFKMLSCLTNIKHRVMLKLCYGMGLRVSEITNLKIADIDSKTMRVHIAQAKGKKDRYVNLPESVLSELRLYYKQYQPTLYLFEGWIKGEPYSIRSVQSVFKQAMKKAGIRKNVGIHSLRHSYATHLLEYGTDITLIQKLLGHNNIKTTLLYTQVSNQKLSNVKSPLDSL